MKQKFSLITFIIGLALVIVSFGLRESYEKGMYQLYIDQQKDSLVKGWTQNWQDYLNDHYQIENDKDAVSFKVDRNGRILDRTFFPVKFKKQTNWQNFKSLKKNKQIEFLTKQLAKVGTWDRAIAIKRLLKFNQLIPNKDLSLYEKTIINDEKRSAVKSIFDQIKKRNDFSNIDKNYTLDTVLIKSESSGEISLTVPSLGYLNKSIFNHFKNKNNVTEIELAKNPFDIQIKKGFNPFKFNSIREKVMMGLGLILLFLAVGLYLLELKHKRLEVLKKVSFLNQLVHEVKTPITGIRLNSELLLRHGHDEELIKALLKSSKRLNDFFEDIILINKGDHKLNQIEMNQAEFAQFVEGIVNEFHGTIALENLIKSTVCIDKGRLRIVLRNLLKNAIRYGKRGALKVRNENNGLLFLVSDEGPGVASADSAKIFEEFYRAKSAKNSSPDGLGIGLSIVNNLVQEMNGSIELVNPGKENATFLLKLGSNHES